MNHSPSNRHFGSLLAFLIFCMSSHSAFIQIDFIQAYFWLALGISICLITIFKPNSLSLLNTAWMKLGKLMGAFIRPIVLGVIFFVIITPISFITRSLGRDELRLKVKKLDSYWVNRESPGDTKNSFKDQF